LQRLFALVAVTFIGASATVGAFADDRGRGRDDRPVTYKFGAKVHVQRLAHEMYDMTNSICWEMHKYYRDNPGFRTTYREAWQMSQDAKEIEDLARRNYHRSPQKDDRIANRLADLDELFHHIESDVRRWRPSTREAYRGGDLKAKMDQCEDILHHLMDDYGIKWQVHAEADHRDRDRDRGPGRR
jgi:hypothetical protein